MDAMLFWKVIFTGCSAIKSATTVLMENYPKSYSFIGQTQRGIRPVGSLFAPSQKWL